MLLQDEKSAKSDLLRAVLARDVAGLREMLDGGVVLTEDLLRLDMMRGAITMAKPWSGRGCPRRSRGWSSANQEEEEGEVDFCCCGGGDLLLLICRAPGYLLRQEMAILLIRHGAPAGAAHLAWAARGGNDDLAAYILEAGAAPPAEGVLAKWEEEEEVPDSLRQMCQSYRTSPRSLQSLCRLTFRSAVFRAGAANVVRVVEELPQVPKDVKKYLTMEIL